MNLRLRIILSVLMFSVLSFSFTVLPSLEEIVENLNLNYVKNHFQFSYKVKVNTGGQLVYEQGGTVAKHGNSFYKKMGDLEIISNGDYAITLDKRIMKIYYFKSGDVKKEEKDLQPQLDLEGLLLKENRKGEILIKSEIVTPEVDSIDYHIDSDSYFLNRVINYKTVDNSMYISEISYDNHSFNEAPSKSLFDLSEIVSGKGTKVQLKSTSRTKGYTFINTLTE